MTSYPEEMGREFEEFKNTTVEKLRLDDGGRQLSSLPLRHVVEDLQISTDRDLKHRRMRCAFVGSDSMVCIVRIVSLSSYRRTEVRS